MVGGHSLVATEHQQGALKTFGLGDNERTEVTGKGEPLSGKQSFKDFIKVCSRRYNETQFLCPYGTSRKITAF